MARVQKNDKSKKVVKKETPIKQDKVSAAIVSEKSEKGEQFFKIVTYAIIGVVLAVVLWLVISSLINKDNDDDALYASQIVTLEDVKKINTDDHASITNSKLSDALGNSSISNVYIFFFNSNYTALESTQLKSRFEETKDLIDKILAKGTESEDEDDNGYISFEDIAVFVVDTATDADGAYATYLKTINESLNYEGPMLLTYTYGETEPTIPYTTFLGFKTAVNTILEALN